MCCVVLCFLSALHYYALIMRACGECPSVHLVFVFRTICKVACKVVGDEKKLLAEGSSKEAVERIWSFSILPVVKVKL